jgi:uncharacterized SAM-binding protein YcdF (DUF218 family)
MSNRVQDAFDLARLRGWILSPIGWLERPLVVDDPARTADAIVVLGAPLRGDRITAVLAERVDAAAAMWRRHLAPVVVATGGVTSGTRAEADAIAEALAERGVTNVLVERQSRSTVENARMTRALLPDARTVWIVTQPFHGRRAARAFRKAGLVPLVWHIADSLEYRDRARALRWLVREYAAWARELLRPKR